MHDDSKRETEEREKRVRLLAEIRSFMESLSELIV